MLIDKAKAIYQSALESVKPQKLISDTLILRSNKLYVKQHSFDLAAFANIYVIGAGKASAYMAQALEKKMGSQITSGSVIVKYGHSVPCEKIQITEAGHPIPDENSLSATRAVLEISKKAAEKDLVIVLLSGGGSSLMECLPPQIHLSDLQTLNNSLISCGADIKEINCVRKHISQIKGGQLAQTIFPATCLTLIISDVPGDDLQSIASGPTAADDSTFSDAARIIKKYNLQHTISPAIMDYIQSGIAGKVSETSKAASPVWKKVFNIIIGNNMLALLAAKEKAEASGFDLAFMEPHMHGEAQNMAVEIAKKMINLPHSAKAHCLLFGGETTVTLKGNGKGGRNQELALAALIELKNFARPFVLLSCGSDGSDGPTDATGAVIHAGTWQLAQKSMLQPADYLRNNDSYHFFEKVDGLIKTGPTGTNVMDIVIALIE